MYASQPAALAFDSSSCVREAVRAMMGIAAVAGSAFSSAVAARPSMPGSRMSIRIRSGLAVRARTRPVSASPALSVTWPACFSNMMTCFMFIALSSITRILAIASLRTSGKALRLHSRNPGALTGQDWYRCGPWTKAPPVTQFQLAKSTLLTARQPAPYLLLLDLLRIRQDGLHDRAYCLYPDFDGGGHDADGGSPYADGRISHRDNGASRRKQQHRQQHQILHGSEGYGIRAGTFLAVTPGYLIRRRIAHPQRNAPGST